ncbi:MAG: hypothetical protein Q7U54_07855 [Bacteroidales bacterium]|nr:hypothetical protein [Bacteroidales bacterium]
MSLTDERMYLFSVSINIFLFVMTKSHEIIKKIDTSTIDVDEIYSKLGSNDKLGFASYIYFGDNYYGIASTIQGPRNKSFTYFVNSVIESINITNYEFKSFALMHQSSKAEVLSLPFIGKTIVQVGEGNNLFDHIKGFLGFKVEDIDSFVIEIRPKRRKSIKQSFSGFNAKINDAGLLKYVVRAKESQEEALEDYYIACSGGVSDSINAREDSKIYIEMADKSKNNSTLTEKIVEFNNAKEFSNDTVKDFADFSEPASWANYLPSL